MKDDIKRVNDIARKYGMSPTERREFGLYIHKLKESANMGVERMATSHTKSLKSSPKIFKRNETALVNGNHCRRARTTSLERLQQVVKGLIGKKCWKAGLSYGGELCLHMGKRIPYHHPKMRGEKKGEWLLGTHGTPWVLATQKGRLISAEDNEEEIEQNLTIIKDSQVTGFMVGPRDVLIMTFSNDCELLIIPTDRDAKYDLPYWELFMPNNKFVAYGPDSAWSCGRSDVPVH